MMDIKEDEIRRYPVFCSSRKSSTGGIARVPGHRRALNSSSIASVSRLQPDFAY